MGFIKKKSKTTVPVKEPEEETRESELQGKIDNLNDQIKQLKARELTEEGIEEVEEKGQELPPMPEPPPAKSTTPIRSADRNEIADMIEGNLMRSADLLRLLRSTP